MVDQEQESQGNPQIGMEDDSFESSVPDSTSGSEDFFSELDNAVNGGIIDNTEATQQVSGSEQVTHTEQYVGSDNVQDAQSDDSSNWETRYKDSSREAVKWRDRYKEVEAFVPVLEAMKKDGGLVEHVRDYLVSGGKPAKSIQEQLNIDEDFVFDQAEAMSDPNSDSAKMMNAHIDGLVKNRVGQMVQVEKQKAIQVSQKNNRTAKEVEFKQKHNMSDAEFETFKTNAKKHTMTLDDINYLLNRDKTNANVANATKQDMLNQMKNVRNIPVSQSNANSQASPVNADDKVFDALIGNDSDLDNLFG
jgi:hypothetical protein